MNDEFELAKQHVPVNAGGRTMRGFLPGIRFEAVVDGGGAAGGSVGEGGGGEAAAAGVGAAADAGTGAAAGGEGGEAAAAPAAPTFDPSLLSDPRVLELVDTRAAELAGSIVDERLGGLERYLQEQLAADGGAAGAAGAGQPGPLNPWDENFGGNLDQRFEALKQEIGGMLQQLAAPLAAREQAETVAEGEQRLQDMLADDVARNGDFPTHPETGKSAAKELVTPLARMIFPQIAERFGATPRAAELAMGRASAMVRDIVAEAQAAARHADANRTSTLAGANGEPPAAGAAGVQVLGEIKATSMSEGLSQVTARHAAALRGQ